MFSRDVTAAILVSQNNEMAAMLVSQPSPMGDQLFLCKRFLLFQYICLDAGRVSENAPYIRKFSCTRIFLCHTGGNSVQ